MTPQPSDLLVRRSDLEIPTPYLVFIGDVARPSDAKTGFGLVDWRREWCVAQWRLPPGRVDLGLPDMGPGTAAAAGARTLVIGVAPAGGRIPADWMGALKSAIRAGLNLASGLHDRLQSYPELLELADQYGVRLFDAREAPRGLVLPVAHGRRRGGRRLLTVGTDCAIGKKYTALAIERELRRRGVAADFRATGQTGVLISGGGLAIDAVVSDFVAGTVEMLAAEAAPAHWDVIEGQGSLFHPAFAGVSLGLLHGAQADAIVVCHDPRRTQIEDHPGYATPSLPDCIALNLQLGRLTSPDIQCVGVSLNTLGLSDDERQRACAAAREATGLPACDPVAQGVGPLVDRLLERCG